MIAEAVHADAVLCDAAAVRKLSGLSGAQVFLMTRDGRHWFVRKAARTPEFSSRLRRQALKQSLFAQAINQVIHTPVILNEGEVEGRFFFDMEFVRGLDAVSYLRTASYKQVADFTDRLCLYFSTASERESLCSSNANTLFDAYFSKLCEVHRHTAIVPPEVFARLLLALERLGKLGNVQPTLCHGDLTLENIVVGGDGEIWVLDLLDAPFEHYWQDIAKVHQDLSGGWYLLRQPPIAQCVLDYLSNLLLQLGSRLEPAYAEVHNFLVACNFFRILPYVNTPDELHFVEDRIKYFADQVTP